MGNYKAWYKFELNEEFLLNGARRGRMQIKTLGLDIGISSIGWAVIQEESNGETANQEIVESGVRIFTKAENPKDKSSLALPRREARSARRRTKRKRERMLQVKKFLSVALDIPLETMLQGDKLAPMFQTSKDFSSPWELRVRALHRQLNHIELARVILHIAKHRGYDDITYGIEDSEGGKIKKFIAENQKKFEENGYRTIGEMMAKTYFQVPRQTHSLYNGKMSEIIQSKGIIKDVWVAKILELNWR